MEPHFYYVSDLHRFYLSPGLQTVQNMHVTEFNLTVGNTQLSDRQHC